MQEIAPNVLVETKYRGVNVAAIITTIGLVCIDFPTLRADAQDWNERLQANTGLPIRYLILTDHQIERAFTIPMAQTRGVAHENAQAKLQSYDPRYPTPLLDSLSARYALTRKELNGAAVTRPEISFCNELLLRSGRTQLLLLHRPSVTPGNTWIYHPDSQVLFTGDTVVLDEHPPLIESETDEWLAALQELENPAWPVSLIVPGRGAVCSPCQVEPLVQFLLEARSRVHALYRAGRPRADTTSFVADFVDSFPHDDVPLDWLQRQLKAGLDHLYDEFKLADLTR